MKFISYRAIRANSHPYFHCIAKLVVPTYYSISKLLIISIGSKSYAWTYLGIGKFIKFISASALESIYEISYVESFQHGNKLSRLSGLT